MSHLMNVVEPLPIEIVGGRGSFLLDCKGREYLDLWGDEGVASLGYGDVFADELGGFLDESGLPQRVPMMYNDPIREHTAELLCHVAGFDRVHFSNSGTEANETAIKLARLHHFRHSDAPRRDQRHLILTLAGNFHGRTGFALAASDSSDSPYHKEGFGPMPSGFGVLEDSLMVRAKDFDYEFDWEKVAAVIMAPILGNNTVRRYPESFWKRLQALREQYGFLLIFDEVQVGMGRTGYICAHQHPEVTYGVRPDIVNLGKGIAGGLPASATLADERIAGAFVPGVHFNTFAGSTLVCWMMQAVIEWVQSNRDALLRNGDALQQLWASSPWVMHFDGVGMHWGFMPKWSGFDGYRFCQAALEHGLLLVTHRPFGMIRYCPPLNTTPDVLEWSFEQLRKTYEDVAG